MLLLPGYELTGFLKLQYNIRAQFEELDEDYAPVSKRFILGDFTRYFEAELRRKKLLTLKKQSNDCENRAFRAMVEGQDLQKESGHGVAWGVIKYHIGGLGGPRHWINWGANWRSTKPVVINLFFYDAIYREETFLTQEEMHTCELGIA
jgi:hypothetical protein